MLSIFSSAFLKKADAWRRPAPGRAHRRGAPPTAALASSRSASFVDANVYPWSSIGKIGNSVGGQCTGAVIGVNQFLTAAHCLYYKAVRRLLPAEAIHLLLGYVRDEYRVHRIASKYVMPPTYDAPVEDRARPDDWVVLYVSDPFPPDIKPLVLADAVSP
jgi:protease YdgD